MLAVDVSASIDTGEVNLQRRGYLAALTNPRVVDAITSGPLGRVALTYVEWAGTQRTVVDWTLIDGAPAAEAFAAALAAVAPMAGAITSISGAIDYSTVLFDGNGFDGTRRVIDISSDGRNSSGRSVAAARDNAVASGITINALPISKGGAAGIAVRTGLDRYYHDLVIGGPGAFMEVADGPEDFPQAILNKLILEIAGAPGDRAAVPRAPGRSRYRRRRRPALSARARTRRRSQAGGQAATATGRAARKARIWRAMRAVGGGPGHRSRRREQPRRLGQRHAEERRNGRPVGRALIGRPARGAAPTSTSRRPCARNHGSSRIAMPTAQPPP